MKKELTQSDKYFWKDRDNRLYELKKYVEEHGIIINSKMKKDDHGKRVLWNIYKYNDLIEDMLIELGYDLNKVKPIATKGYYNEFENVVKKIEWFIENNKRFPTISEIFNTLKIGHRYIQRHGGVYEIKRKMNYFDENDLVDDNLFVNLSLLEFYTAQFLIYHNVEYKRERLIIPDHSKKYRYDFYLIKNDVYIEIWGIDEKNGSIGKEYSKKRKAKEKLYKENNLNLLSIEPYDLKIHDINQVIDKLTEIFSPYFKVEENIPQDIFVSSRTISDEDILNHITPFTDNENYLPIQEVLNNNDLGYLTRLIRKRHVSYYNFAKEYGFKIHGKNIDVSEINEQIIYEMINDIFSNHKKDIEQKDLKKYDTGKAIIKWINKNSIFDLFKVNYYNARLSSDEIIDKSIFSFLIRFIRNSDYDIEMKNKCQDTINNVIRNIENKNIYEYVFKRLLVRFPYTEQEYIENFNKVTMNASHNITPNGFEMNSKMSYYSYLNHYDGMSWLDIVKLMGKSDELHNYICEEFKEYAEQTNNCSMVEFTKTHPYITLNIMKYQDIHKWIGDANIINANKKRYIDKDFEINFLFIKDLLHKVPLYHEFIKYTKISFNTYQAKFNFNKNVYDNIVKMYVTKEEYNEYLRQKKIYTTKISKETGSLSRKHSDDDLKNNFISVFEKYKNNNGKYPSRRNFSEVSSIDDSTYRKRLKMSWLQVTEYYGFSS